MVKRINLEGVMERMSQSQKEDLIERAMAVGFDPVNPMTVLVIESLRAGKWERAVELAEGNA